MSKIRISVPLYRRTLFEDGWRVAPIPADVIPPPDNEWKRWTDLPPLGKLNNPCLSFEGWQLSPLPADNELSFTSASNVVQAGRDKHSYIGWTQAPLAADNDVSFSHRHYDVPEPGIMPLRFSYDGWVSFPLSADNEEAAARSTFEVPWGRDKHTYVGVQVSPTPADNNEGTVRSFDLPELGLLPLRFSYEGWRQQPLPGDNELSSFHALFDVPWGRDRNSYEGLVQQPLSEDFFSPLSAHMAEVEWTSGKDKNQYEGWQAAPTPEDVVVVEPFSAHSFEFDVPLSKNRSPVADQIILPLSADNEVSFARSEVRVPPGEDGHTYVGFQSSPLPPDNDVSFAHGEMEVPLGLDRHSYDGFQGPILPPDNERSFSASETGVPGGRDRHTYGGWQQVPLAADNDPSATQIIVEVPRGLDRLPNWGFSFSPLPGDVQDPVAGFRTFDLPPKGPGKDDFTFAHAGTIPELEVQDTMPPQFTVLPFIPPLTLADFSGSSVSPTPDDVVFVPSEAIYRPTFRPRRR